MKKDYKFLNKHQKEFKTTYLSLQGKKWSLNFENFSKAWEALKDPGLKFRNCKCQK